MEMEKHFYKAVSYRNIQVSYLPKLDGGGGRFGQEFIRVVREKIGKVNHVFEFCAGPGFIGFSLLAHGLCNKLTLADINPEAVKACQDTIEKNKLVNKVSVYLSDCLDTIPETEKWDLAVSNPPHWPDTQEKYQEDITKYDPGFIIHRKFYRDIAKFLKLNGTILMQENERATKYEDFIPMIKENNLESIEVFHARVMSLEECVRGEGGVGYDDKPSLFYFIWSKKKLN